MDLRLPFLLKKQRTKNNFLIPVLITLSFLHACDNKTAPNVPSTTHSNTNTVVTERTKQLDLSITPEMIDKLVGQQANGDFNSNVENNITILNLDYKKIESRIKVDGEVFYDTTQGDYLDAIDGGRVKIEIKFK